MKVTKVLPDVQKYPGYSEETFELFEEGNKTRHKPAHSGLASFSADPHFARYLFEEGWKQLAGTNLENHLLRVMSSKFYNRLRKPK